MKVFLLLVASGRPLFYSEVVEGPEPEAPRGGLRGRVDSWFHRVKEGLQNSQGRAARWSRAAWDWLHRRTHPDEVLYARLRHAAAIDLHHPESLGPAEVEAAWSAFLAAGRRRHWPWFVANAAVAPLSVVLAPLPGPNLLGYWFVYRAFHHLFILVGLGRARSGRVATRLVALGALDRPVEPGAPPDLTALGYDPEELDAFLRRRGLAVGDAPDGS